MGYANFANNIGKAIRVMEFIQRESHLLVRSYGEKYLLSFVANVSGN